MKLSVIIPVYNVSKTLERCMDSVLAQTYDDCEFILIDDGSTDGSSQLCDDYMAKDKRIKVLHKENAGLSEARNDGVAMATGEYITFVDSDDYIAQDTYKPLMQQILSNRDIDILEYPVNVHYGNADSHVLKFDGKVYTDKKEYWFEESAYSHAYMWNKIMKRSLFDGLSFPKGKKFEDSYIYPSLLDRAEVIAVTDVGMYYYCWNNSGITVTASSKDYDFLLDIHVKNLKRFDEHDFDTYGFLRYYLYILNLQCQVYRDMKGAIVLPRIKMPFLKNIEPVIKQKSINTIIKFFVYSLYGVETTCRLVSIMSH